MTYKEWRETYLRSNKIKIKIKMQEYYKENEEKIREYARQRYYINISDYQKELYWNKIQGWLIKPMYINEDRLFTKWDLEHIEEMKLIN